MSQIVLLNESTASNRIVYLWSLLSNGTSPAQFEAGGQPKVSVAGIAPWSSAGTLLAVDTTNGEYCVRLGTSDVSVAGPGIVRYSSSSALETSIPFQIVGYNPYDGTKLGLTSVSTFDASVLSVGLKAVTHSAATVFVGGIDKAAGAGSGLSFLPAPGDYGSTVTVGVDNIAKAVGAISGLSFVPAPGTYSALSVSVAAIDKAVGATSGLSFAPVPGDYSSTVTVGVAKIKAGTYSGVTVGSLATLVPTDYSSIVTVGVGNVIPTVGAISGLSFVPAPGTYSSVTVQVNGIAKATYSGVTVGINNIAAGDYSSLVTVGSVATLLPTDYSSKVTVGVGAIKGADYSNVTISGLDSGVTVATGGIVTASFGAGAIDSVALATSAENGIADQMLGRNIQGGSSSGNSVGAALATLRNRVQIDGSIGTVYKNDGTTSWWTFSAATVSANSGVLIQVTTH